MEPTVPEGLADGGLQALHVGLLLFGDDLTTIQTTLLPGMAVEALEAFHTAVYAPSSARAHQQQLRAAGFQPGSLFSGNSRRRVLAKLPAGAFGPSEFGDSMASLLTAYDACKLPLAGLVTGLVRRCGPAALVRAVYECLEGAGVDTELLSLEPAHDAHSAAPARDEPLPAAPDSPAVAKPRLGAGAGGRRKCMCANCSATVSSVWRPGNAGLLLCNACGMFFRKHGHQHRPEHMIASARSRAAAAAEAAAAAGTAGADGAAGHKRCASTSLSDSDDDEEGEEGAKNHRRRRRVQLTRWLADDYVLTDGLGSEPAQDGGLLRATSDDSAEEPDVSAASTLVAMSRCHLSTAQRTRLAAAISGCSSPGRVASPCSPGPMSRLAPSPFAAAACSPEPAESEVAVRLAPAEPAASSIARVPPQAAAAAAAAAAAPPSDWAYEQLDYGLMSRLALQLMPGLAAAVATEHGSTSGSTACSTLAGQQLYAGTDYGSSSCCDGGRPGSAGGDGGGDGRSPVRARARSRFAAEVLVQDDKGAAAAAAACARRSPSRVDVRTASDGSPLWCDNCGVSETPLWRRDKSNALRILCNACGIFKATSGKDRPKDGVFPRSRSGSPVVGRRAPVKAPAYQPYARQPWHPASKRSIKRAAPADLVGAAAAMLAARPAVAPAGVLGVPAETAAAAVVAASAAASQGGRNDGLLPFAIHPGAMAAGPLCAQQVVPAVTHAAGGSRDDGLLHAAAADSSKHGAGSLGGWAGSWPGYSAVVREGSFAANNNNCTSMAP